MPSALVQLVKSSGFEASQHFRFRPCRLVVASGMSNRNKTNLATEVLNVLYEGVARELRVVVSDESIWHTGTAN